MAMIAEAVGVSRPALYQWFDNREDVFRAAMQLLVDEAAAAALAALRDSEDIETALRGWLRRAYADNHARLAGNPHGEELLEAHHEFSTDVADQTTARMRDGLERYLRHHPAIDNRQVDAALELLLLSPAGLKADEPTPAVFGERLDGLAAAVAALVERPRPA